MKHTSGPWAIDLGGALGHIKSAANANSNEDNYRTPTVARYDVITPSLSEEEKKANARLIAAAPDMYDFLRAVIANPVSVSKLFVDEAKVILDKIDQ